MTGEPFGDHWINENMYSLSLLSDKHLAEAFGKDKVKESLGEPICRNIYTANVKQVAAADTELLPAIDKPSISLNALNFQYKVGVSLKVEKVQCTLAPTIRCKKVN